MKFKKYVSCFGLVIATACSTELPDPGAESSEDEQPAFTDDDLIDVTFQLSEEQGLSLASASAFSVSVDGCASGYTGTISEASGALEVYKFDRNCLAKLTTFTINSTVYTPSAGDPFTTWLAGDTATFESGGESIQVSVIAQLSASAQASDIVHYSFSQIEAGTTETIAEGIVGGTHTLTVDGQAAPNFDITAVTFDDIDANGAGMFTFEMTCNNAMIGDLCDDVDRTTIDYKLLEDTYSGSLSMADANTIFATAGSSNITNHANGNGGFDTESTAGPNQIHLKPNMILILRANGSYQYFEVDVTTVIQN